MESDSMTTGWSLQSSGMVVSPESSQKGRGVHTKEKQAIKIISDLKSSISAYPLLAHRFLLPLT